MFSLHYCPELLMDQEIQSHLSSFLMQSLVQECTDVNHRLSITVYGFESEGFQI
ncbi:hypothetical protein HanPSC8_Chr05g0217151 [Helianthus annuus]|nr:hypothetical protein HanPSC8_Chr05g0217151 [Helianthus annuus]